MVPVGAETTRRPANRLRNSVPTDLIQADFEQRFEQIPARNGSQRFNRLNETYYGSRSDKQPEEHWEKGSEKLSSEKKSKGYDNGRNSFWGAFLPRVASGLVIFGLGYWTVARNEKLRYEAAEHRAMGKLEILRDQAERDCVREQRAERKEQRAYAKEERFRMAELRCQRQEHREMAKEMRDCARENFKLLERESRKLCNRCRGMQNRAQ